MTKDVGVQGDGAISGIHSSVVVTIWHDHDAVSHSEAQHRTGMMTVIFSVENVASMEYQWKSTSAFTTQLAGMIFLAVCFERRYSNQKYAAHHQVGMESQTSI